MKPQRTQVAIVGAGPAGLLLAHLLHQEGIRSEILENHTREYVEHRVRAGVLAQGTVDVLQRAGLGARLQREGLVHDGVQLQFGDERHRIALAELTGGRAITVYGQQEVVKDLIQARLAAGEPIHFESQVQRLDGIASDSPSVVFRQEGVEQTLAADFIAGCDGFHGVSRRYLPAELGRELVRDYPYAWLGILAQVQPSSDELVYVHHPRGFALLSQRSPTISRLYIQVDPHERIEKWPDDRIWEELDRRVSAVGGVLPKGPLLEKGITAMRAFVREPMQHGRLFLAGDAAHIVPPTGAKGLNMAVADVGRLAAALTAWYRRNDGSLLERYSVHCAQHVWRAQEFSSFMTTLLHLTPGQQEFDTRLQLARLRQLTTSRAAATVFAENYVG